MTRFIYDQFAKDYLEELLKNYGEIQAPYSISSEVREIDVYFSPFPKLQPDLQNLGLLGQLATTPAIFEPYRNPVTSEQIGDCLLKLLEVQRVLKKESVDKKTKLVENQIPRLWIITPTLSDNILSGFGATQSPNSLTGVYEFPRDLRTGIIVIHQLPEILETLWLRILGRDKVQQKAIDQLLSLDANQQFKQKTLELFYTLRRHLEVRKIKINPEVDMTRLLDYYQQDRALAIAEGIDKGKSQGKTEGELLLVTKLLTKRFKEIKPEVSQKIQQLPLEKIEDLAEALLDFNQYQDLEIWLQENL